jgi:hypothetical protein
MKCRFFGVGLLAVLTLGWPAVAADKKTPADKKSSASDASPGDYQAILDAHTVTGKLTAVGGSDKSFALRVEYQVAQPNPNYKGNNGALGRLLREQDRILRSRNPYQQAARLQQLQLDILKEQGREANAVKFITQSKDFDLESTPTVVVRTLELPADYDDKGNPKKYTAAEVKELKGNNPDLPGYTSSFDKLLAGQVVRVSLVKPKADKEKDKDATTEQKKPQAKMIVIVKDAPSDPPAKAEKKAKKNK